MAAKPLRWTPVFSPVVADSTGPAADTHGTSSHRKERAHSERILLSCGSPFAIAGPPNRDRRARKLRLSRSDAGAIFSHLRGSGPPAYINA
jgi:hypothetical protein